MVQNKKSILSILIDLLADQEGVKISYTLEVRN
jgi:hypothetical protein